ncbi:hypothetical protein D1615_21215 [Klebsiella pneumoniae]|nr:hypothetical protein D1615_21215 [Klebsiella pneumoniae]
MASYEAITEVLQILVMMCSDVSGIVSTPDFTVTVFKTFGAEVLFQELIMFFWCNHDAPGVCWISTLSHRGEGGRIAVGEEC